MTYNSGNYEEQGGLRWVIGGSADVASGGEIDIESGGAVKIAGTAITSSAAEINYLDLTTGPGTAEASKAVVLSTDAQFAVETTVTAGANVGHIIKMTGAAAGTYTGTNAGLQVKNYDADDTVVHSGGENVGLAVWLKTLSEPQAGGEYALITAHMHGSNTGTIKYGAVFYGDFTNGLALSGGTVTNSLFFDNQTSTNFASFAAGAEARVSATYCDVSANTQNSDGAIRILVGGTEYFVPLYTAGNTDNSW